jgi:hypothetical protein
MTSWIKAVPRKVPAKLNDYIFQTTEAGFCSQFNQFFYSYLYVKSLGNKLRVSDKLSPLGPDINFLKLTFEDIPGVEYTDTVSSKKISFNQFLSYRTNEELRTAAKKFFKFKPAILEEIKKREIPLTQYDIGIHIRSGDKITTGEMKAVPLQSYIEVIRSFQKQIAKPRITIFVMTDNYEMLEQLKANADTSWSITTLPSNSFYAKGHVQGDFNLLPRKTKEDMYYSFLTELSIMKRTPYIICTFSSNIGRFLYLTCDFVDNIKSLDMPVYTPM